MIYNNTNCFSVPIRAIENMGITLKPKTGCAEHQAAVLDQLHHLTPLELNACMLHFIEGHSQTTVAGWLGVTPRMVRKHIASAVQKVPGLCPLRTKSLKKVRRPKILQFSQLRGNERGPFNADEI